EKTSRAVLRFPGPLSVHGPRPELDRGEPGSDRRGARDAGLRRRSHAGERAALRLWCDLHDRAFPARRGRDVDRDRQRFDPHDEGGHWRPLPGNLPTAWVEDLQVHGNDLVAATNGRALWILDDVTPLRQTMPERSGAVGSSPYLFAPAAAVRVRRNVSHDTPLPPETPMGQNPPAGAVIDYVLPRAVAGPVALEILDSAGRIVRSFSSADEPEKVAATRYFAQEWLKPAAPLSGAAGHHRFVWDLRGPRPKAEEYEYSIAAISGEDTPAEPEGVLVPPGIYSV